MRRFWSYGPIDKESHYYVPRQDLIDYIYTQLVGTSLSRSGHYITVWAPRQTGKTWIMQQVLWELHKDERFDVLKLNLEHLKMVEDVDRIAQWLGQEIAQQLKLQELTVSSLDKLPEVFRGGYLKKPLILILDEFDALAEDAISGLAGMFRNIYNTQRDGAGISQEQQTYLLHSLALIGVRSVLGIENERGSPFNIQHSLHIPNLTYDEVLTMYHWYEEESGQTIEPAVIDRIYDETQGQPGLVSWLGELITETYNEEHSQPITSEDFESTYSLALNVLPNNNVVNIISKARQEPYIGVVLELFRTQEKLAFTYDDPYLNYLYLNGVIDWEQATPTKQYVKFPCPFIQKRLFNYFARTLFRDTGQLIPPFADLSDTITNTMLDLRNLLRYYEQYLQKNRDWLLKDVPRRQTDMRIFEAVYHFNLYRYLISFLENYNGRVIPEFPTGNGKVDLLIEYVGQQYAIEIKSYANLRAYKLALEQAARYGGQLGLNEITLVLFIEAIDKQNREKYEVAYVDTQTGVSVNPVFVVTG
ncbi:MAG: AAA-like domain-containing protein [Anaerolineae bacterium]|nr:AAA-like domain-containing protein [Anaerolineae bacterium]